MINYRVIVGFRHALVRLLRVISRATDVCDVL